MAVMRTQSAMKALDKDNRILPHNANRLGEKSGEQWNYHLISTITIGSATSSKFPACLPGLLCPALSAILPVHANASIVICT